METESHLNLCLSLVTGEYLQNAGQFFFRCNNNGLYAYTLGHKVKPKVLKMMEVLS